jgi:hypothetical protein
MGFAADFPHAQEFWFQFERYPYRAVQDAIIWQVCIPFTPPTAAETKAIA